MTSRPCLPVLLLAAAVLGASPLAAQTPRRTGLLPVRPGVSVGVAAPSHHYQSGCEHSHFVLRTEARTRGEWFAAGALDLFSEGVGADVACLKGGPADGSVAYVRGGLDLGGAVGLSGGVGRRAAAGPLGLEAELRTGLLRGGPGYAEHAGDRDARWLPWAGGSVGVDVLDHLWISYERRWTRLPFRTEVHPWPDPHGTPPPAPGEPPFQVEETRRWGGLGVLRIGVRL